MIAFSLNCDPMNIPISRNEEDMEDLYTDDFFWLHERGVDYVFIFIFFHMFRKFYVNSHQTSQEGAWKTGSVLFLFLHVVTFFGLVLCCTHLSEVTLTIAANMLATLSLKVGKIYWWFFPAQELNTDTVLRLMYGHYTTAFIFYIAALIHSLEMHYDWKDMGISEAQKLDLSWWDDAIKSELTGFAKLMLGLFWLSYAYYDTPEPVSIELFMWGDTGPVSDIRFYGVTPHWYFRAYMSWLIVCPHHYLGLLGLLLFMTSIYYQPTLKATATPTLEERSKLHRWLVVGLILSVMFCASYLPYGKFYNRLGGNKATLASFMFVLAFMLMPVSKPRAVVWDNLTSLFHQNRLINKYSLR